MALKSTLFGGREHYARSTCTLYRNNTQEIITVKQVPKETKTHDKKILEGVGSVTVIVALSVAVTVGIC